MCVLTGKCHSWPWSEELLSSNWQWGQRLMDDQSSCTCDIWGLGLNNASVPTPLRSGEHCGRKGRKYLRARRQGLSNVIFWASPTSCHHGLTPTLVAHSGPAQDWPLNKRVGQQSGKEPGGIQGALPFTAELFTTDTVWERLSHPPQVSTSSELITVQWVAPKRWPVVRKQTPNSGVWKRH